MFFFHFHTIVVNVMMVSMIVLMLSMFFIMISRHYGEWAVIRDVRNRLLWVDKDIMKVCSTIVIFCSVVLFLQGIAYLHTNFIPGDLGVLVDIVSAQPEVKEFTVF